MKLTIRDFIMAQMSFSHISNTYSVGKETQETYRKKIMLFV